MKNEKLAHNIVNAGSHRNSSKPHVDCWNRVKGSPRLVAYNIFFYLNHVQ